MRTVTLPKYPNDFYKEPGAMTIDCRTDKIIHKGKTYSYDEWDAFVKKHEAELELKSSWIKT